MALLDVFLTRNHMLRTYAVPADWEIQNNYRYYLAVEINDGSPPTWQTAITMEIKPRYPANEAKFDMKAAFRRAFNPTPPAVGSNINALYGNTAKKFRLKRGDLTGAKLLPDVITTEEEFLALYGGLSKQKFAELGHFFFSYLSGLTPRKFLTWAPPEKQVDRNQEDYLSFWLVNSLTTLKLQCTAYYDDGTNQTAVTKTKTGIDFNQVSDRLWYVPVGPANSGVLGINAEKNLVKYVVRMLNQADAVISEERTFVLDPVSYPNRRFIMFLSSLGSFEVLRFYGTTEEEESYERQPTRQYLAPGYSATEPELKAGGPALGTNTLNLSTGFFEGRYGKQWQLYMRDLLRSPHVWDVTSGKRVPLVVTSSSLPGPQDRNYQYFARLTAVEAYTDDNYTPADV